MDIDLDNNETSVEYHPPINLKIQRLLRPLRSRVNEENEKEEERRKAYVQLNSVQL